MSTAADDSPPTAALLDALLVLSQPSVERHPRGLLGRALEALLTAAGCTRGIAYSTVGDALMLVGEHGLPAEIRPSLQRLALVEAPWFIAQQAAHARGFVADRVVVTAPGNARIEAALAAAGWLHAMACPVVVEKKVHGVLMIATPASDLGAPELTTIQIMCNLLAAQLALRGAERRLSEHGDARSARLAAFGLLAGGFAGEMEPAVAAIEHALIDQQQLIGRMRRRMPVGDADGEQIAALTESTAHAARHVRESAARLLVAVRAGGALERLDLGRVVDDALALLGPVLRSHGVDLRVRCPAGHFVAGRKGELIQLVVHAVLNLVGALDESATGEGRRAGARSVDVEVHRQDAHEVLSLIDPGEDPASARTRLLTGTGTAQAGEGMGLALARQIVIAHHGHIEIGAVTDAGGVRCDVVLPRAAPEADLAEPAPPKGLLPHASLVGRQGVRPSILWIDDDELSSEIALQSLKGCEVHLARTADEATQLLFKSGAPPSLIFCNLRLPDRPGHHLHEDIAGFSQDLADRFVFLSDGVLAKEVAVYLLKSGRPTLMRPVDVDRVRELAFGDRSAALRGGVPTLTPPERPAISPRVPAPTSSRPGAGRLSTTDPQAARTSTGRLSATDPQAARTSTGRLSATDPQAARTSTGRLSATDPQAARTSTGRILGAASAAERPDIRVAPTEPQLAAARPPPVVDTPREGRTTSPGAVSSRYQTLRSSEPVPGGSTSPREPRAQAEAPPTENGAGAPAMRDQQLAALARAISSTLQREGPKRGSTVLEMLRARGLAESEALSVVMYALSTGALVRDPPWSTMLRARGPTPNKSVLVVDDDADVRQALREVLEEDGYLVETARQGREALAALRRSAPPQVVVLDMTMPVMDGWDFLHEVRQDAALAHIPILVLSGGNEIRSGNEFLRKPVDSHMLLATVARLAKSRAPT